MVPRVMRPEYRRGPSASSLCGCAAWHSHTDSGTSRALVGGGRLLAVPEAVDLARVVLVVGARNAAAEQQVWIDLVLTAGGLTQASHRGPVTDLAQRVGEVLDAVVRARDSPVGACFARAVLFARDVEHELDRVGLAARSRQEAIGRLD